MGPLQKPPPILRLPAAPAPPSLSSRPELVSEIKRLTADGFTGFCDRRRYGTSTPLRWRPPTSSGARTEHLLKSTEVAGYSNCV
jgi:hypothetical protein